MRLTRFTAIVATALAVAAALSAPAAAQPTHPAGSGIASSGKHPAVHSTAVGRPDYAGVALPGGTIGPVHYATLRPSCGAPSPGRLSCQAVVRVPATAGTAGAIAYREPDEATGPAGGFTPADLVKVYSVDPFARTNAVVAVVDAYNNPRARSELDAFDRHYGFPQETASSLRQVGQAGTSKLPATDWGWSVEIALDLQAVRTFCRHCRILVVEANSSSTANLAAAENTAVRLGATVVSNSYGGSEAYATSSERAAYNHPGVAIVASTGDDGWYSWDDLNEDVASEGRPNVPAAFPTVVAVGGTTLTVGPHGNRASETVWNSNGQLDQSGLQDGRSLGASGGGCSSRYAAPWWQQDVPGYEQTGCWSKRLAGDVSMVADPTPGFAVFAPTSTGTGHWAAIGGTSLSAPLVAALIALAGGAGGVAYPSESIYRNARYRPHTLYDVTSGSNAFCGGATRAQCQAFVEDSTHDPTIHNPNSLGAGMVDCTFQPRGTAPRPNQTQCTAAVGYDGPSGVGVPVGIGLLHSTRPRFTLTAPTPVRAGVARTVTASSFIDPIGSAAKWTFRWGDHTAVQSGSQSRRSHAYTRAGTYTVAVSVVDNHGQTVTHSARIVVLPAH